MYSDKDSSLDRILKRMETLHFIHCTTDHLLWPWPNTMTLKWVIWIRKVTASQWEANFIRTLKLNRTGQKCRVLSCFQDGERSWFSLDRASVRHHIEQQESNTSSISGLSGTQLDSFHTCTSFSLTIHAQHTSSAMYFKHHLSGYEDYPGHWLDIKESNGEKPMILLHSCYTFLTPFWLFCM